MSSDGILDRDDQGRDVVRFERRLAHPVPRVWAALTDPAQLRGWWGAAEVDLEQGGRFQLRWLNTQDKDGNTTEAPVREATITRLEPPHLIETDGEPHGLLRFELRDDGAGGTVLTFTCVVEVPEEYRTANVAGWHFHLDALASLLDGGSTDLADVHAAWEPIHELYVARYG